MRTERRVYFNRFFAITQSQWELHQLGVASSSISVKLRVVWIAFYGFTVVFHGQRIIALFERIVALDFFSLCQFWVDIGQTFELLCLFFYLLLLFNYFRIAMLDQGIIVVFNCVFIVI